MSWNESDREDKTVYRVVINQEEQYSILPAYKSSPSGWRDVGKIGPKLECLAYIKEVWTDMRPLSLRIKTEEFARNPPPPPALTEPNSPHEKSLVDKLSERDHKVEVGLRPEKTLELLKEAVDRGYVHIKFTETKGGTEIGFQLDRSASNFNQADFIRGSGTVHLEGNLKLDYVRVKCVADIDLTALEGKGRLLKMEAIAE